MTLTVTDEYERRGIDTVFLENDHLRVEILAGKGGDITEIRDKRTDVDVLLDAPHNWRPPEATAGAPDGSFAFLDHYPGGWQDVLPGAGGPSEAHGATLGLHGESAVVPWEAELVDESPDHVGVRLSVTLTRYPFDITREITLHEGESTLRVSESLTNCGEVTVAYSWLQHIALGRPLIGPDARLDVPCERVLVDPDQDNENARLPPGASFDWPTYSEGDVDVDLRTFPPLDASVHDLVSLAALDEGRYTVSNPRLNLGVTVQFPSDLYEYIWYWQPLGGFDASPFFGRSYGVGLEPCTSIPNAGLDEAIANGTANHVAPGETVQSDVTFETHAVDTDG